MDALAFVPHQGTLDNHIIPGLRHVTKNRAIFYFHADDAAQTVKIVAVFFGSRDHQRLMLSRVDNF